MLETKALPQPSAEQGVSSIPDSARDGIDVTVPGGAPLSSGSAASATAEITGTDLGLAAPDNIKNPVARQERQVLVAEQHPFREGSELYFRQVMVIG